MKTKNLNLFKKDKTIKVLSQKQIQKVKGGRAEVEERIDSWYSMIEERIDSWY